MKITSIGLVVATVLATGVAQAEERSGSTDEGADNGFSLAATIGEVAYHIDSHLYRGPFSLELVPSFGRSWLKLDLGLLTTLESVRIAGSNVGYWNFTFRPGGRLAPPMIPVYLRAALPLQIQQYNFDWGVMFGVGADVRVLERLGFVFEIDTTLSKDLEWGNDGIPWEFRSGVSLHF